MQIQSLPWLITTPRMFLLLSASTAIGFQPWLLSAASTGQSFKKIQIFSSYNRSSKRPTVQTSSLAVDLLRERFSFKITLKSAEELKMNYLWVFHLNRGNDLATVLNSAICIRLLPNNSFRLQKYKKIMNLRILLNKKYQTEKYVAKSTVLLVVCKV